MVHSILYVLAIHRWHTARLLDASCKRWHIIHYEDVFSALLFHLHLLFLDIHFVEKKSALPTVSISYTWDWTKLNLNTSYLSSNAKPKNENMKEPYQKSFAEWQCLASVRFSYHFSMIFTFNGSSIRSIWAAGIVHANSCMHRKCFVFCQSVDFSLYWVAIR